MVKEFASNPILERADSAFSDTSIIQKHLNSVLPEHMIPTKHIQVENFPLNSTGKLDTKKLLTLSMSHDSLDIDLPEGPTEATLSRLFPRLLGKRFNLVVTLVSLKWVEIH
ncbi:hypothetical protein AAHB59_21515 [Bacillus cereus]